MKILVINQPLNNRGDEAAHKGFIRSIVSYPVFTTDYYSILYKQ